MLEQVNALVTFLNSLVPEAAKHDAGNAAAGIRLRAGLQTVKTQAQDLRAQVLEEQKQRKEE